MTLSDFSFLKKISSSKAAQFSKISKKLDKTGKRPSGLNPLAKKVAVSAERKGTVDLSETSDLKRQVEHDFQGFKKSLPERGSALGSAEKKSSKAAGPSFLRKLFGIKQSEISKLISDKEKLLGKISDSVQELDSWQVLAEMMARRSPESSANSATLQTIDNLKRERTEQMEQLQSSIANDKARLANTNESKSSSQVKDTNRRSSQELRTIKHEFAKSMSKHKSMFKEVTTKIVHLLAEVNGLVKRGGYLQSEVNHYLPLLFASGLDEADAHVASKVIHQIDVLNRKLKDTMASLGMSIPKSAVGEVIKTSSAAPQDETGPAQLREKMTLDRLKDMLEEKRKNEIPRDKLLEWGRDRLEKEYGPNFHRNERFLRAQLNYLDPSISPSEMIDLQNAALAKRKK